MKEILTHSDVLAVLDKMARDLTAQAETLRDLDAAIGDGDLGITVTLGFQAVTDGLADLAEGDPANILMKSGMAFNRRAASTFGALFATMLMRAARVAKGRETLDLTALAEMTQAAVDGVRERGKAEVGDKTLLDALAPAAQALAQAASQGETLAAGLAQGVAAAECGLQATVEMKSKIGRASWFSERTQGVADPGAMAIVLLLRSLYEYVTED